MNSHRPLPPDDARHRDELDSFLEGLAHGRPTTPPNLDPALAATVRHVHRLANEHVAAETRSAGKAQRWEDLMRPTPTRSIVTPFPMTNPLPRSSTPPIPFRPVMPTSRLRRLGGQSLGLVATLTLVLLVAASSLALYLSAPQRGDEPTTVPAAFGATPTAESAGDLQNPRVKFGVCDVTPMTFDEMMSALSTPSENGMLPLDTSPLDLPLPDGANVDRPTEESLTLLTETYIGCGAFLEHAAISTDDGIIRMFSSTAYFPGRSDFNFLNGDLIVQAWQHRDDVTLPNFDYIGGPSPFVLTELRQLPDGRVAGYLSRSYSLDADGIVTARNDGYIAFAQVDGRWLIDDFRPAPLG